MVKMCKIELAYLQIKEIYGRFFSLKFKPICMHKDNREGSRKVANTLKNIAKHFKERMHFFIYEIFLGECTNTSRRYKLLHEFVCEGHNIEETLSKRNRLRK